MKKRTLFLATGLLGLLCSANLPAEWDWTFPNGPDTCWQGNSCANNSTQNSRSYDGTGSTNPGPPSVTATAWSNSEPPSDAGAYGEGVLRQRYLASYGGGLGVINSSGDGDHEVDNQGWIDAILLNFESPVTLTDVTFGWADGDSDFTVARYAGTGTTDITQYEYDTLATHGWEVIGSYFAAGSSAVPDVASGAEPVSFEINAAEKSSSYWLISALNPKLDDGLGSFTNTYKDKFKLKAVAGQAPSTGIPPSTQQIPEASALSLLLFGLLLAVVLRGRHQRSANEGDETA